MQTMKVIRAITLTITMTGSVLAQGPLVPSGAPAPTMKSLDQVEPRWALTSAPVVLTQPGSYYLAGNLTGTVTIAANDVTLDLMGFALVAASGNAIYQSGGRTNVLVRNGIISAPGGNGLEFSWSSSNANGRLEDLRISGCQNNGMVIGGGFDIRNCTVQGAGLAGIHAYEDVRIRDCVVTHCGRGLQLSGVGALVEGNRVYGNIDNYSFTPGNQLNLLLCEIPESLDWSCSVRLAGSLVCSREGTNGITVNADDVSIDMAGHTLAGPGAASGSGIQQDSVHSNLRVYNGVLRGWRGSGQAGLRAEGIGVRAENISVVSNYMGMLVGGHASVRDCTADSNESDGIYASILSTLDRCRARLNGGNGLGAGTGAMVTECRAEYNGGAGLSIANASSISGCAVHYNVGDGIWVTDDCVVTRCFSAYNSFLNTGGSGIRAGTGNRLEENSSFESERGFRIYGCGNFIAGNVSDRPYDVADWCTQGMGPIINAQNVVSNVYPAANVYE